MATFRKRSNSWQARVQLVGYPDQSKSFKSYAEAVAWARKVESEIDSGVHTHQSAACEDFTSGAAPTTAPVSNDFKLP